MKRALIIMSRTGGGHVASALAIKDAVDLIYGEQIETDIVDLFVDHMAYPISSLPKVYDVVVEWAPRLWQFLWHGMARPSVNRVVNRLAAASAQKRIEGLLTSRQPDIVVSVHPLVNYLVIPVLQRMMPSTPYITVITDLETIHPLWFHPGAAATIAPFESGARIAVGHGINSQSVFPLGFPVRAQFTEPATDKKETKNRLGLHPELPVCLIVGGASGVGRLLPLIRGIAAELANNEANDTQGVQLAVVCGRNDRLRRTLGEERWPIPVVGFGFVDRMSDLMQASDLIVTKAGSSTIAEAMVCGLPIIISSFIPGQEEGNVSLVVDNSAGLFIPNPRQIGFASGQLLGSNRELLQAMAGQSRALARPEASRKIADMIFNLLKCRQPALRDGPAIDAA